MTEFNVSFIYSNETLRNTDEIESAIELILDEVKNEVLSADPGVDISRGSPLDSCLFGAAKKDL